MNRTKKERNKLLEIIHNKLPFGYEIEDYYKYTFDELIQLSNRGVMFTPSEIIKIPYAMNGWCHLIAHHYWLSHQHLKLVFGATLSYDTLSSGGWYYIHSWLYDEQNGTVYEPTNIFGSELYPYEYFGYILTESEIQEYLVADAELLIKLDSGTLRPRDEVI